MIYDKKRLVKNYLTSLPETSEGVPLATLEDRISEDICDGNPIPFRAESVLHQVGWYKHHHTYEDGRELQARRCYCTTESLEACNARKSVPPSAPLPPIATDYETNPEAGFWHWVCNLRAGDNPRGDFIRDTRDLLIGGEDPDTSHFSACAEATQEYIKLRVQWAAENGVHPADYTPLDGRPRVTGTGWYYCCPRCNRDCNCDGETGCDCDCTGCEPEY